MIVMHPPYRVSMNWITALTETPPVRHISDK